MKITSKIYGRSGSNHPDMLFEFDILEELKNGVWTFGIGHEKHQMLNELIDELNETEVLESIHSFVSSIIENPKEGFQWVRRPELSIAFDDVTKKAVISKRIQ